MASATERPFERPPHVRSLQWTGCFFQLRDGVDVLLDPEGIEVPNLEEAKRLALASAYDILAEDIRSGKLNLGHRIDVEDAAGNVVHTLRFRDLVEITGLEPN